MKTVVIFRKWPNGDIIALMPELPGTHDPRTCTSYEHIGQHSAADYAHCIAATKRATAAECLDLARELRQVGYKLAVRDRATAKMHATRRAAALSPWLFSLLQYRGDIYWKGYMEGRDK
jgi:hypothetical protein